VDKIKAFFLLIGANPVFQWAYKVSCVSVLAYFGAVAFEPTQKWFYGLVAAIGSGLYHGFDVWLKQQNANAGVPQNPNGLSHVAMLKRTLKTGLMLFVAFTFLAAPAHADWLVKAKSLSTVTKTGAIRYGAVLPSGLDENDLILLPTAALGLGVGDIKNSYGFSAAYGLLWCHVKGVDATHSTLTPYLGVGAAVFVDAGPWLTSDLKNPIQARFGINVIGPELVGIVPSVMQTWDWRTGERRIVVNANVPFGLFSDATLLRLFHL